MMKNVNNFYEFFEYRTYFDAVIFLVESMSNDKLFLQYFKSQVGNKKK